MGQLVKTFSDGSFLEYDRGSFDKWCVYFTNRNGKRNPPRDADYFRQLKTLATKYGTERIYNDFVRVYNVTGKDVEQFSLDTITEIAAFYGNDTLAVDILFSTLYMAMISEENKANTHLGKRIKRLGIHKLLVEGESVSYAANFMYDMNWQKIAALCKERGF